MFVRVHAFDARLAVCPVLRVFVWRASDHDDRHDAMRTRNVPQYYYYWSSGQPGANYSTRALAIVASA